jgi:hypothetical protein
MDRAVEFALKNSHIKPQELPDVRNWFGAKMLMKPYRWFVIKCIKDPLRKTMVSVAKRMAVGAMTTKKGTKVLTKMMKLVRDRMHRTTGLPTRETCKLDNTKVIFDIKDKFFERERNLDRSEMFEAAFDIAAAEVEHDGYYDSRLNVIVEDLIEAILDGRWKPRAVGRPQPPHWRENPPYGGQYGIIARIQAHREEILELIKEPALSFEDTEESKRQLQTAFRIVNSLHNARDPRWKADDGDPDWNKYNPKHSYKRS